MDISSYPMPIPRKPVGKTSSFISSPSVISSKTSYTLVTLFIVILCLTHVHNCDARPYQSSSGRSSSGGVNSLLPCGHRDTRLEVRSGRPSQGSDNSILINCLLDR